MPFVPLSSLSRGDCEYRLIEIIKRGDEAIKKLRTRIAKAKVLIRRKNEQIAELNRQLDAVVRKADHGCYGHACPICDQES